MRIHESTNEEAVHWHFRMVQLSCAYFLLATFKIGRFTTAFARTNAKLRREMLK